jgi:hypothetical protein
MFELCEIVLINRAVNEGNDVAKAWEAELRDLSDAIRVFACLTKKLRQFSTSFDKRRMCWLETEKCNVVMLLIHVVWIPRLGSFVLIRVSNDGSTVRRIEHRAGVTRCEVREMRVPLLENITGNLWILEGVFEGINDNNNILAEFGQSEFHLLSVLREIIGICACQGDRADLRRLGFFRAETNKAECLSSARESKTLFFIINPPMTAIFNNSDFPMPGWSDIATKLERTFWCSHFTGWRGRE